MTSRPVLVAACVIVLACDTGFDKPIGNGPVGPLAPTAGFVLSGTVRDETGLPLPGAMGEVIRIGHQTRTSITGDDGVFRFEQVAGSLAVLVSKLGYATYSQGILINADHEIGVFLAKLPTITLGQTIHSTTNEPPCDPVQWDAHAPCRRFYFAPPSAGQLVITISCTGFSDVDAVIVLDNRWPVTPRS